MDDSPWDDDPTYSGVQNSEWLKLKEEFTTAGYREGITAGKEIALQEGFDEGFAEIGVPIGREVGRARGTAAALMSIIQLRKNREGEESIEAVQVLSDELHKVGLPDIEEAGGLAARVGDVVKKVDELARSIVVGQESQSQ